MEAVALRGGIIRPRVAIAKSIASALCIGSGGSAGREGPIVQIGSAVGSMIGQLFRIGLGCLWHDVDDICLAQVEPMAQRAQVHPAQRPRTKDGHYLRPG